MAETGKVNPTPEAAKPAAPGAVDATKYVGTPAVGTSKAAAGVVTRGFVVHSREVLAEENVFCAITIRIRHGDSKGGSELSFDWQRLGLEMISPIQEDRGVEPIGLKRMEGAGPPGEQFGRCGRAISLVGLELVTKPRRHLQHPRQAAPGQPFL